MDPFAFTLEALFAVVFLWAFRAWLQRRDVLSLDVLLVFSAMAAIFALQLASIVVGPPPPIVTAIVIVLLLGQPVFTLRLASEIRTIPRAALAAERAMAMSTGADAFLADPSGQPT